MTTVLRRDVSHRRIFAATVVRILRQLRHDHRTVALILVVPVVLMTLLYFMFSEQPGAFSPSALVLLPIFPFILMFLITSVAMLRERSSGTLERLCTTPASGADLLFGYGVAFGLTATVQAALATGCAYAFLGLQTAGAGGLVVLVAVLTALLGVGLGLLCSAFARTEFQAVQFLPVVVIPQLLLCGLFVPRADLPSWLAVVSDLLPVSYAVEAAGQVSRNTQPTGLFWRDLAIVCGCIVLTLLLASATLHRRTE